MSRMLRHRQRCYRTHTDCGRTRVNQKVKAIFKLRGNRERNELAHCAVLTMLVDEFGHVQYSSLPSVEWQQRGRKHGRSTLQDCTIEEQRGVVRFLWAD